MTTRDMNNNEALEMLNRCKHEIMHMRETINQLKPKADAYDNLTIALHYARPVPGYGAISDDIIWTIQKRIDELTSKPETKPANPTPTHKPDPEGKFNADPYSPKNITETDNRIHDTE